MYVSMHFKQKNVSLTIDDGMCEWIGVQQEASCST